MIELPTINDYSWYLKELSTVFVNGNAKEENVEKYFIKNTETINQVLIKLGISNEVFSNYHGLSLVEELAIANFSDLKIIKDSLPKDKEGLFWNTKTDKDGKEYKDYIEPWKSFRNKYDSLVKNGLNTKLVERLETSCCPYCNENFINNRNKSAMAQLDHFYPRSEFPIFSISINNLVPSCYYCNHKKRENLIGLSPHDHSVNFSEFKISYKIKSVDYINNLDDITIDFKYNGDKDFNENMEKNIKKLNILDAYNEHKDYLQEILKKAFVYNELRVNELYSEFPDLFSSKEEIIRAIFGNYINKEELLKRPLSKLTYNILIELGIIFK